MILIMTATVYPEKKMGQTALKASEERKKQYEESLKFYISSRAFDRIIFCDNSNFDIDTNGFFTQYAKENNVKLESLSFSVNIEECIKKGKGYGEGEILRYAIQNGKISEKDYFVKVTGRLKVDNVKKIVRVLNEKIVYFNIPNHTRRDFVDTRIFAMPVIVFRQFFMKAHLTVFDNHGYYLEHAYTEVLGKNHIKNKNLPLYPRIVGTSGTSGGDYTYKEWKCRIKDFLSKIQYYRVKNPKKDFHDK